MLIVFSGLPGAGKTTVSRRVAATLKATYLRIDAIEQAIRNAGVLAGEVGVSGYGVAQAVAEANLADGRTVVADCVNPVAESRSAWRAAASRAGAALLEVEVVCSDAAQHRRRVTTRIADIPGHVPPTWDEVVDLDYQPWDAAPLVIDTARQSPQEAAEAVIRSLPR